MMIKDKIAVQECAAAARFIYPCGLTGDQIEYETDPPCFICSLYGIKEFCEDYYFNYVTRKKPPPEFKRWMRSRIQSKLTQRRTEIRQADEILSGLNGNGKGNGHAKDSISGKKI